MRTLTPIPVALDPMQQYFTARLTNVCEGSKLKKLHDYPIAGAPIYRIIKNEHE